MQNQTFSKTAFGTEVKQSQTSSSAGAVWAPVPAKVMKLVQEVMKTSDNKDAKVFVSQDIDTRVNMEISGMDDVAVLRVNIFEENHWTIVFSLAT